MSFRARLRPLKRTAAAMIAQLWCAAFALLARVSPLQAQRWESPGRLRVLVLAPHPDDEAIGCGGTVLRHADAGDEVCIAIATDGRRAGGARDPVGMATRRYAEARRAALALRATRLEWLAQPEWEWHNADLQAQLKRLLHELRPDVVYAPSQVDFHPEHHRVAHALALALEASAIPPPLLRVYQIQVPLTARLVNLVCELRTVKEASERALRAYESQAGTVAFTARRRRYSALRHGLPCDAAEEFWQLAAARYVALHREAPELWLHRYRGLRAFPLTDPLAWLVGRRWRSKLSA